VAIEEREMGVLVKTKQHYTR